MDHITYISEIKSGVTSDPLLAVLVSQGVTFFNVEK